MKVGCCIKKVLPHRAKGKYLTERCEIGEFFFIIFTFYFACMPSLCFGKGAKGGREGAEGEYYTCNRI